TCLGHDIITESAAIKRQVGYMTQKFSLYEDLSIAENLDFVARMYQVPERPRRVADALDRLGLASRKAQLAGTLSGGWKQRLALARELRVLPGVEMVVPFGGALHVSGTDERQVAAALQPLRQRQDLRLNQVAPGLEDVFIHLMRDLGEAARPAARGR